LLKMGLLLAKLAETLHDAARGDWDEAHTLRMF